ncbi:MAG: hypothetical protein AAF945_06105 [Actinomycetota bacterium]
MLAASVLVFVGADPRPAGAQSEDNGLSETSVNTFLFDAEQGIVRVTVDIDLRNVTTDQRVGNQIRQAYFDSYFAVVPLGAENVVATRNGQVLAGELVDAPESDAFSFYEFDLGRRIFSGQSTSVQVTYDHLGAPPRDEVIWRVNEAYASFLAFGFGDPGQVTLRIVLPYGYEFDDVTDLTGFEASEPDAFASITYERSGLAEDDDVLVSMSNDDRLVITETTVDGADFDVASWPGDDTWTQFVIDGTRDALPVLEQTLGSKWPLDELTIRQAISQYFLGYGGYFDGFNNEIALGEEIDRELLFHELSHAWIDDDLFAERWLIEGFAQVVAADVLLELDGVESSPESVERWWLDLLDWGHGGSFDMEEYGYAASWWVVDQIVDELGPDDTRAVLDSFFEGYRAYPGGDPSETWSSTENDWRRFVDVVDRVHGDLDGIEGPLREWVLPPSYRSQLDRRSEVRDAYESTAQGASPWAMPPAVRDPMERWEFALAEQRLEVVDGVSERLDDVRGDARRLGVDLDLSTVRDRFETTRFGFDDVLVSLDEIESDAMDLDAALDEMVERSAAWDVTPAEPYAAGAPTSFGQALDSVESELARADELDDRWAAAVTELASMGVAEPELVAGGDEPLAGFAQALDRVGDLEETVDRLTRVDTAVAADRSLVETIGLLGTDSATDLDAAERAIEGSDLEAADRRLSTIEDRLDGASESGWLRLSVVGGVLLLLAVAVVLLRRRSRRRRSGLHVSSSDPTTVDIDAGDSNAEGPTAPLDDVLDDPSSGPVPAAAGTVAPDGAAEPPASG